jgi:hypothetical protein
MSDQNKSASEQLEEKIQQQKKLQAEIDALKAKSKEADLEKVKELIKLHGFTATNLRSVLKKKPASSTTSTTRKPAAKKPAK